MHIDSALGPGPIVVGTDLSPLSKSILDYASTLAIQESRNLHLVYVMPILPEDSPDLLKMQEIELDRQVQAARRRLQNAGLLVAGYLALGTPAYELIKVADELDACCLVVGTHELSSVERLLLGSVAEFLIHKSNHPVIVVGPKAASMATSTLPWKNLMLACDTAQGVTEAARLAGEIAIGHQARLTIFTVRRQDSESPEEGQFDPLEPMMSREAWLAVKPQCLIREGEPAEEIVRMAEDAEADLLVMSTHCGGSLLTHLRSGILARVLRTSRCPAMILREFLSSHSHPVAQHAGASM